MSGPFIQNGATLTITTGICSPVITGVTAGNTLIVKYAVDAVNATIAPPTDSAGGTWQTAATFANAGSSGGIFFLQNAVAGTHTLSFVTRAAAQEAAIEEVSGIVGLGGAGVTSSATAATLTSGSYTPASNLEYVVAFLFELGTAANDALHCNTAAFQGIGTLTDSTPHACTMINQNGNTENGVESNSAIITSTAALTVGWSWTGSVFCFSIVRGFTLSNDTGKRSGRPLRLGTPFSRLRAVQDYTVSAGTTAISAGLGAYSWTGTTSTASGLIQETAGAYSWAGTTATTSSLINAVVGAYSWAGVTTTASALINASIGAYTWAGTAGTVGSPITAAVGAYTWSGTTASASGLINATSGAYSWAGSTSGLTQSLAATVGTYSWAGTTAAITQLLSASIGAYTWSATTGTLGAGAISASVGSYVWSGLNAGIPTQISSDPSAGYFWSGTQSILVGQSADAGSRRYRRYLYFVTIDGQQFECNSVPEALALLAKAKETAKKLAEDQALWSVNQVKELGSAWNKPTLRAPIITVSSRELRSAASQTKREIVDIYAKELQHAEIRMLLELSQRAQDDEDSIILLM